MTEETHFLFCDRQTCIFCNYYRQNFYFNLGMYEQIYSVMPSVSNIPVLGRKGLFCG